MKWMNMAKKYKRLEEKNVKQDFAKYLKQKRARLAAAHGGKFTQLDMVNLLSRHGINIPRGTYGGYEAGYSQPGDDMKKKMREVLANGSR